MAAPKGAPSPLGTCIAADPTPARSSESSDNAADAEVAMASPMPKPVIAIHRATNPPLEPILVVVPSIRPAARKVNPAATASLAPIRRATWLAGTAPSTNPPMSGNNRRPDPMAVAPSTPWKYWGIVNRTPIMDRTAAAATITPHRYEAERKIGRAHV